MADMVEIRSIKTSVKLTAMSWGYCRCCYSSENLKRLSSPALDVYLFICNTQGFENGNINIETCLRCSEFLVEVHRFKIKCLEFDKIFRNNLDIKNINVESTFRNTTDEKSSQLVIKTEINDEYNEFEQIDVQINKVEVNSDHENSQMVDIYPEIPLISINPNTDDPLHDSINCDEGDLLIEMHDAKERQKTNSSKITIECEDVGVKTEKRLVSKGGKLIQSKLKRKYIIDKKNKMFECTECSYKTRHRCGIRTHVITKHSEENPFSCDQCNYHTKMKRNLIIHKRKHLNDSDKPYKCSECSYTAINAWRMKDHITRKHTDEKPFSCDQCDYCVKTKYELTIHKRKHLDDSDMPYKCSECSFTTIISGRLKEHIMRKHSNEKPFSCDQCNYCGKTKYELTVHVKSHLINREKPFECSQCSHKTITMTRMKEHIARRHCVEKPFTCDRCNYSCKTRKYLIAHQSIHLDKAKFLKCNECSYETRSKYTLSLHMARKHSDDKPFGCDQCDFRFKVKQDMTQHKKRVHPSLQDDADKLVECSECSFKTTANYLMRRHILRKHSDQKPLAENINISENRCSEDQI